MNHRRSRAHGFSLIEVMIAMLILAIGILGAGALQTIGLQTTQGAYFRSQAIIFAGDIVDRMRANRDGLASYIVADTSTATASSITCLAASGGCSPSDIASADLTGWIGALTLLPNASASITSAGTDAYAVTIHWNENEWTGATRGLTQQTFQLNVSIPKN